MINTYNTIMLANGLRVVHRRASSPVVYCGFCVDAGTRDEAEGQEGLAHFCEHMTFKGTTRRTAMQVIDQLESVGGELNAFTTKEDTVYYAAVMNDEIERAIDLLADVVFHSVYPSREISKEVEVICDEIESYNDTPYDLIYDEFENILFRHHPLGHNILGTADRVRSFTTADALSFTRRFYRPDRCVFFISGDVELERVTDLLCRALGTDVAPSSEPGSEKRQLCRPSGQVESMVVEHRATHQRHVMTGCRAYAASDRLRMPLYLLNNIIGGPGLNSRLNIALRERKGLVYTVESMMTCYGDTGLWAVYFGCDPDDAAQCSSLVRAELDKLMAAPLSPEALAAAKRQLKGQLGIASDNRENFILDAAKAYLHYDRLRDLDDICRSIDAISSADISEVATTLFAPDNMTTLVFE